jgi:hypothetical protein
VSTRPNRRGSTKSPRWIRNPALHEGRHLCRPFFCVMAAIPTPRPEPGGSKDLGGGIPDPPRQGCELQGGAGRTRPQRGASGCCLNQTATILSLLAAPTGWSNITFNPAILSAAKNPRPLFAPFANEKRPNPGFRAKKVARHSTALGERRHRCYLPVLAGFTRLPMHGTWPRRTVGRAPPCATKISLTQTKLATKGAKRAKTECCREKWI